MRQLQLHEYPSSRICPLPESAVHACTCLTRADTYCAMNARAAWWCLTPTRFVLAFTAYERVFMTKPLAAQSFGFSDRKGPHCPVVLEGPRCHTEAMQVHPWREGRAVSH